MKSIFFIIVGVSGIVKTLYKLKKLTVYDYIIFIIYIICAVLGLYFMITHKPW